MQNRDRMRELLGDDNNNNNNNDRDVEIQTVSNSKKQQQHPYRSSLTITEVDPMYVEIVDMLNKIETNSNLMTQITNDYKTSVLKSARQRYVSDVETIINSTKKCARNIKIKLDIVKPSNNSRHTNDQDGLSASDLILYNKYSLYVKKFHDAMNRFQLLSQTFKDKMQARMKREIRMVMFDKHLTDQQVDDLVQSNKANEIIQEAIMSDSNLKDMVHTIEERHVDIMKLESSVKELFDLFKDLATLVDLQQENLDVITIHIGKAQSHVQKAEVDLQDAEIYQKKGRAIRCCLLFIALIILAAILIPTLLKTVVFA